MKKRFHIVAVWVLFQLSIAACGGGGSNPPTGSLPVNDTAFRNPGGGDPTSPYGSTPTVSIYKSTGSVQCSGGGTTIASMAVQLAASEVSVLGADCGSDGLGHAAVCGGPDGKIGIFDIPLDQVERALALGFRPLSELPDAGRVACQ